MPNRDKTDKKTGTGDVPAPPASPDMTASYDQQLALLRTQFGSDVAGVKLQRGLLTQEFMNRKAAIQAQKIQDLAAAEGSAMGRGITGSSIDTTNRINVEGAAQAQTQEAAATLNAGLGQLAQGKQQAMTNFQMGQLGILGAKTAAEYQAAVDAYNSSLLDDTSTGGGGGGGGGKKNPPTGKENQGPAYSPLTYLTKGPLQSTPMAGWLTLPPREAGIYLANNRANIEMAMTNLSHDMFPFLKKAVNALASPPSWMTEVIANWPSNGVPPKALVDQAITLLDFAAAHGVFRSS